MPVTKKTKMRRQGASLKRKSGRRDLLGGASSRSQGRRDRANANADVNRPDSLANPVRQRSHAMVKTHTKPGKTADSGAKGKVDTKIDFATGRVLFPVEVGGKTQYLPVASEASEHERRNGNFVTTESIQKESTYRLDLNAKDDGAQDTVDDVQNQRQLFATLNADGKREYLPSESDADALELANGKYIADDQLASPSVALGLLDVDANKNKQQLHFDFTNQRNLFAVRTADGRDIYLPTKSKATAGELKRGLYIDDALISKKIDLGPAKRLTNDPARLDLANQRKVYGVKDPNGKTVYFPKASDANALELARGLFIADDVVIKHERDQRRTALAYRDNKADHALRRAQRADKLAGGVTARNIATGPKAVTRSSNGIALWDGFSLPEVPVEKRLQTLKKLRPIYDLNENRMLYPTVTAKGKTQYLPLLKDATDVERINQHYAAFVPHAPLAEFIANQQQAGGLVRQTFDTDQGQVQAFAQADIDSAFSAASALTLRSAALVSEAAKLTPALQQQWDE